MAKVVLKNICKKYDTEYLAVNDFSMEIEDKEFVVLVGPSGCGKSTTLRMIAGLEQITSGEIYIGEKLVNNVEPKDRDIAMVFQSYALYPHMTVFQNMSFSLEILRVPKAERKKKVEEVARVLGLEDLLGRKPKHLSGGQRQRVAIGRAIVREPQVFLMDEPLSNLDAKLRNRMRAELIQLRSKIDTTFVYVTHDQIEAMTLGDRIVIMNEGKTQQIGTPEEVFTKPSNLFVAEFIGSPKMNIFEGARLEESGGEYRIAFEGRELELTKDICESLRKNNTSGRYVKLGVRPEHIDFCEKDAGKDVFESPLTFTEMLGSTTFFHTTLGGTDIIIDSETSAKSFEMQRHKNEAIRYSFREEHLHLFDVETGKNLMVSPD